jgi:Nif-specific regulatory protein
MEKATSDIDQIKTISREQFDILYHVSQRLNSVTYQASLIEETLDLIIQVIKAERGLFAKCDSNISQFSIIAARNLQKENIPDLSTFSSGILQQVIQLRKPCLYHDVQSDPKLSQFDSVQIHNIKSVLGVPIIRGEQVWGVILVDSRIHRQEFTEENLIFLDFLSNLVSLAFEKIVDIERLQEENIILRNQLQSSQNIPNLIGKSPAMKHLVNLIHKVADTDATVLLLGESGTGKELVAQAIHNLSSRKDKPYLAQFCGSIPDTLLESELFGYKKGAFTGAASDKKGLFEVAEHGTFFLDEIADISSALQAKLLRVLQNKEIILLGGTQTIKVNVRIIAASNQDLKELVNTGKFREDLFYRLNVFPITIPPLRERKGDISLLANYFVEKFSDKNVQLIPETLQKLENYYWPGNVRQLENVIQRALILCDSKKLTPEHIIIEEEQSLANFKGTLEDFQMLLLNKRLKQFEYNRTLTAKSLGVSVRWVQMKLKELEGKSS